MEKTITAAKPIWLTGREREMNLTVGFRALFVPIPPQPTVLRIAASSLYRAWINGKFVGHGPARGPHGFYRVDEWDLTPHLVEGENLLAIEVAGYNVNSFYLLDQPAFLQAEVRGGGTVLASTDGPGAQFEALVPGDRVKKVPRYSFQRTFCEAYHLTPSSADWRTKTHTPFIALETSTQPNKQLIPHHVPLPKFALLRPTQITATGTVTPCELPKNPWKERTMRDVLPTTGGYREAEMEEIPPYDVQRFTTARTSTAAIPVPSKLPLTGNSFAIVDYGVERTGFIGMHARCSQPTTLYITFSEILENNDVNYAHLDTVNIVVFHLQPGEYELEAIEPYSHRYQKITAVGGACEISDLYIRELACPDADKGNFKCSDESINRIFEAARQTFRQNATDVFMDCPSRERAGWLCDSFFTSRVAVDLSGHTRIEHNFLQNYALPPKFEHIPDGMIPMCYPSDHTDGVFIPNWAMWFVVELDEYARRGGDKALVQSLKPRVTKLVEFFQKLRNSDGLLEKLPSWVFVEWSAANNFMQDVNYPSNMLWAGTLDAAARLYGRDDWKVEAQKVRDTICAQSYDGEYFVDNAVRADGKLKRTTNRSETCQYYAFFFQVATPKSHPALWKRMCEEFGPQRKKTGLHPEIHASNAFIGNYLRLEALSQNGEYGRILKEVHGYFDDMARITGTLWEHDDTQASCCHGFASHVAHVLLRDVLGIRSVDRVGKRITISAPQLPLEWCEGTLPLSKGKLTLRWERRDGKVAVTYKAPSDYHVTRV